MVDKIRDIVQRTILKYNDTARRNVTAQEVVDEAVRQIITTAREEITLALSDSHEEQTKMLEALERDDI